MLVSSNNPIIHQSKLNEGVFWAWQNVETGSPSHSPIIFINFYFIFPFSFIFLMDKFFSVRENNVNTYVQYNNKPCSASPHKEESELLFYYFIMASPLVLATGIKDGNALTN